MHCKRQSSYKTQHQIHLIYPRGLLEKSFRLLTHLDQELLFKIKLLSMNVRGT